MFTDNFEKYASPLSEWSKLSTNVFRNLAQQQLEFVGENISRCSNNLNRLTHVKSPEELINLQKDIFNENVNATVEHIQRIVQISISNVDECANLCSSLREKPAKRTEKV